MNSIEDSTRETSSAASPTPDHPGASSEQRLSPRQTARPTDRDWFWIHIATLAAALLCLLYFTRNQWFNLDEWAMLTDRSLATDPVTALFAPHNEHWSTLVVLIYRSLFAVFGLHTYVPYLLALFAFHLLAAHFMWRILRRMHVSNAVATGLVGVFLILGAGWENLTAAFQLSLVGSLAAGLLAILLLSDPHGHDPKSSLARCAGSSVLLIASVMLSGVGITMIGVFVLFAVASRRILPGLLTVIAPIAAYGAWFLLWGKNNAVEAPPIKTAIDRVPEYVWTGLTGSIDAAIGLVGGGLIIVASIIVWVAVRGRPRVHPWTYALPLAAGSVLFLLLTALRRSHLGVETATASRYVYIVVLLMLPVVALGIDRLLSHAPTRRTVLTIGLIFLLSIQVAVLRFEANTWGSIEQEQRRRILATSELLSDGEPILNMVPAPRYSPNLQTSHLNEFAEAGRLPESDSDPADIMTAREYLQVSVDPDQIVATTAVLPALSSERGVELRQTSPSCRYVVPLSTMPRFNLTFDTPGAVSIMSDQQIQLDFTLASNDGSIRANVPRNLTILSGYQWLSVATGNVRLEFSGEIDSPFEICGLKD